MKRAILWLTCVLIIFCAGCSFKPGTAATETTAHSDSDRPAGLYYDVPGIPAAGSFSGTELNTLNGYFSTPIGATLYALDTKAEIATDDPRLIQLLNLLAYSRETDHTWLLQGYDTNDEVASYFETGRPLLEIQFTACDEPESDSGLPYHKIIVGGDMYMTFKGTCNNPEDTLRISDLTAGEYYPFMDLMVEAVSPSPTQYMFNSPEYTPWIDLLIYCGFTN